MTGPSEPLAAELADTAELFAHWRRTRTQRSAPTPLALRERAVALLAAHRPATVARGTRCALRPATRTRGAGSSR